MGFLKSKFRTVGDIQNSGESIVVLLGGKESNFPVVVTHNIEETNFTSVWFNSADLPWQAIGSLAQDAFENLNSKIRFEKPCFTPVFNELSEFGISEVTWE
ncbi:hypothetical protein ACJJIT_13590 [Microbulbifer sp. SSSA003]|uniref:hypothetical protein n=1 Tax=Microbulbifer sp. SSSA003 TaxID=3243377 RepID=UPI00403970D6